MNSESPVPTIFRQGASRESQSQKRKTTSCPRLTWSRLHQAEMTWTPSARALHLHLVMLFQVKKTPFVVLYLVPGTKWHAFRTDALTHRLTDGRRGKFFYILASLLFIFTGILSTLKNCTAAIAANCGGQELSEEQTNKTRKCLDTANSFRLVQCDGAYKPIMRFVAESIW